MRKIFFFVVLLTAGFQMTTNAQKIAHINASELIGAMPETKKAQERLQKLQDSLQASFSEMYQEYQEKDSIMRVDSAKWTPARKDIKLKEFQELAEALQNYSNGAQQYLQQKDQEFMEPVQKKAKDAISEVAKANGYAYVISSEALIVSPAADDLLAKVKAFLKITDKPAAGGVK